MLTVGNHHLLSDAEIPIPSKAEQKRIIHAIHGIFTQLDLIMESL